MTLISIVDGGRQSVSFPFATDRLGPYHACGDPVTPFMKAYADFRRKLSLEECLCGGIPSVAFAVVENCIKVNAPIKIRPLGVKAGYNRQG